ncbi:AraC family transcriptional regulator [Solwaraspora sp. WMMA2056]|uniref:helix-turn-helix domain-containing protein n=1 Tax=Solwaraspora sp. WMMA2056 TaxID=3015161 RepID=UPI00259B4EC3|nr:AraC family transcriptional regulator [Solwaraspora sp. WMMA2056]WJK42574.1 AraC family transcriptional regulator [Solwaraspora sp. WMMA2056]
MGSYFEAAVERAIEKMQENLGDELTVDDLARAAMFSKFHFTRIFQRVTGVTPGRFLSALRVQHAKALLLTTSMNVADISVRVGYNSIGTFSSRFTRSVGMPPTAYRRCGGVVRSLQANPVTDTDRAAGMVSGSISADPSIYLDTVFLGLFRSRIPEGRPVRCTIEQGSGGFLLDQVPDGEWYLLCHGLGRTPASRATDGPTRLVGYQGPLRIHDGNLVDVKLHLEPARKLDPPLLVALPEPALPIGAHQAAAPPDMSQVPLAA